ncbi:hypothetical protein BJ165DRAFT_1534425 [Panaeolus papilionaceus]|nr:hypothetical protein BJ165DRAFT_1534425 [Panaeolus papilionaceus]
MSNDSEHACFFDVKRILRPIDPEKGAEVSQAREHYDESDDESDVDLRAVGDDGTPCESRAIPAAVSHLPMEVHEEIDMSSVELVEVLADAPQVEKRVKSTQVSVVEVTPGQGEDEEGSDFELTPWV